MVDLVKSFRLVKKNSVYLARLVEAHGKVADSVDKLSFTAKALGETVRYVRKYTVSVKEVDYGTTRTYSKSLQMSLVRETMEDMSDFL